VSNKITHKNSQGLVTVTQRKRLVDLETGEEFESYAIVKQYNGDTGFKKVFLGEVLSIIDEISNAKMKFLMWLLDNVDKQNRIIGTYPQLSEASGISRETIARLIPILLKANVLKRLAPSVYMLNPDISTSLSTQGRRNLLIQYVDKDEKQIDFINAPN
jgi:hypothetical protein